VGRAISAFCKFAVSSIAWRTFTDRTVATLSRLGDSLEAIISGLEGSTCASCISMRQELDISSLKTLSPKIKRLCYDAAKDFPKWLCNHLAQEFKSSNINMFPSTNSTVSIDMRGGVIYEYTEMPEYFRELWDSNL
jgi:hypothetical protein